MNKKKLIELRCKAWGITEDEYYCNQCSDFSLEDMARAYRRGKNKRRADLENKIRFMGKQIDNLKAIVKYDQLIKAKEIIQQLIANAPNTYSGTNIELQQKKMFSFQDAVNKAEQFLEE